MPIAFSVTQIHEICDWSRPKFSKTVFMFVVSFCFCITRIQLTLCEDSVGRFLKVIGDKLSSKSDPNAWPYCILLCNIDVLIDYFSRKLGHFLFQPLITLNSYCLLNSSFSPTLGIQVPTYCTNRLNISSNVHCIQTQLSWVNTIRNASPS